MNSTRDGFTLIELMLVVTVILIIATIAIPSLISARISANEAVTVEIMRSISTSQAQFAQARAADEDGDNRGEYGCLGELAGATGVRGGAARVPTDIRGMQAMTPDGEVQRNGYYYRMYLPAPGGLGVRENPGGGMNPGVLDPDMAEIKWCCYAWPANYSVTGRRTFFVNQSGEIITTEDPLNAGPNCASVHGHSAFITTIPESITGMVATGTVGGDGNFWKPVD